MKFIIFLLLLPLVLLFPTISSAHKITGPYGTSCDQMYCLYIFNHCGFDMDYTMGVSHFTYYDDSLSLEQNWKKFIAPDSILEVICHQ